jgi:hypothetical protein
LGASAARAGVKEEEALVDTKCCRRECWGVRVYVCSYVHTYVVRGGGRRGDSAAREGVLEVNAVKG